VSGSDVHVLILRSASRVVPRLASPPSHAGAEELIYMGAS